MVVVGASAGGVEALVSLVSVLPADLRAALFVVLHVAPGSTSVLADILDRAGPLPVAQASHGEAVTLGRILVAPPDHHLLLTANGVELDHGPKENGHRPAVDTLFRSAAAAFGSRVIGIVLSGSRDDGAAGLAAIKAAGGMAMAQSPDEALYPSMPEAARDNVQLDAVASCRELARLISGAAESPIHGGAAVPTHPNEPPPVSGGGGATGLTCPECGGALWEQDQAGVLRFVCHVGHSYSTESMLEEHGQAMEAALWTAVRLLMERAGLLRQLADRLGAGPDSIARRRFEDAARECEAHAETIREGILSTGMPDASREETG